jgi:hypothetical protein
MKMAVFVLTALRTSNPTTDCRYFSAYISVLYIAFCVKRCQYFAKIHQVIWDVEQAGDGWTDGINFCTVCSRKTPNNLVLQTEPGISPRFTSNEHVQNFSCVVSVLKYTLHITELNLINKTARRNAIIIRVISEHQI